MNTPMFTVLSDEELFSALQNASAAVRTLARSSTPLPFPRHPRFTSFAINGLRRIQRLYRH
eukprot:3270499-Prymnesium_polylepis.1